MCVLVCKGGEEGLTLDKKSNILKHNMYSNTLKHGTNHNAWGSLGLI